MTQNIDALHLRAGSSLERTHQIHGSITYMRCWNECCEELFPLPKQCELIQDSEDFETVRHLLVCPKCGGMSRPHVLWFDECYNEHHYRVDSALNAASNADLLIVAGTTLMTNVPSVICEDFYRAGKPIINIDIELSSASRLAERSGGAYVQASSSEALPEICRLLL